MNYNEILEAINTTSLTTEEMRSLNNVLIIKLKANRRVNIEIAKTTLNVGMQVKVNHPKLKGRVFTLNAINRTTASVTSDFGPGYKVPLTLLESI
jgi:hypothetical protein